MNMARPKKARAVEDAPQVYKLTLVLGDKTYESTGSTVFEALRDLEKPEKIMHKGILTLEHDGKRTQQLLFPARLKRLFYSPTFQQIQAKQLESVGLKPIV
jgi:hypothetical protein